MLDIQATEKVYFELRRKLVLYMFSACEHHYITWLNDIHNKGQRSLWHAYLFITRYTLRLTKPCYEWHHRLLDTCDFYCTCSLLPCKKQIEYEWLWLEANEIYFLVCIQSTLKLLSRGRLKGLLFNSPDRIPDLKQCKIWQFQILNMESRNALQLSSFSSDFKPLST